MKIQSLYPKKIISKNATDYLYKKDIEELCEKNKIIFLVSNNFICVFLSNFYILLSALLRRLPILNRIMQFKCYWSFKRHLYVKMPDETDIVFTNNLIPFNKLNCPIILEADFVPYGSSEAIRKKIEKQLYISDRQLNAVSRIIVRSMESVNILGARNKEFADKCVIIPHYMPYIKTINNVEYKEKINSSKKNIVFVGNQSKRKGIEFLIELYNENVEFFHSRLNFYIVTNFKDGYIDLPKYFKVKVGYSRYDVFNLLKKSHFFIMPTKEEAFGKVFVEAMAAGCVTFIPDVYPLSAYFSEGGVLFNLSNKEKLIIEMKKMLENDSIFEIESNKSLSFYEKNYSPEIVEKKYVELFHEVISNEKNSCFL